MSLKIGDTVQLLTDNYSGFGVLKDSIGIIFGISGTVIYVKFDGMSQLGVLQHELAPFLSKKLEQELTKLTFADPKKIPDVTMSHQSYVKMASAALAYENLERTSGVSTLKRGNPEDHTSKRYNEGKVQTREIDPAFILGIGEVLTKSRAKYDHFNWTKPTKLSTPYESLMRHLLAFQSGENVDKESGSHHLLHCATNLMFLYYHIINNPDESDDRFFYQNREDI